MRAKHIQWNEIQLEGCGVCGSVAIVPWSDNIFHQCTACGSMLYKKKKVKRSFVENDDGSVRRETDEEMRERTHYWNDHCTDTADGNVVLIKRNRDEHQRLLALGSPENQQARLLGHVLDSWGFESLEERRSLHATGDLDLCYLARGETGALDPPSRTPNRGQRERKEQADDHAQHTSPFGSRFGTLSVAHGDQAGLVAESALLPRYVRPPIARAKSARSDSLRRCRLHRGAPRACARWR